MNRNWLIGGACAGLGASLIYLFDPIVGRRRRALIRDQFIKTAHQVQSGLGKTWRDATQRAQGVASVLPTPLKGKTASDRALHERVRAKLGRYVSHPGAIEVGVRQGRVRLSGPILSDEVGHLLKAVAGVSGVRSIENRLDPHRTAGRVSALQGGKPAPGEKWNIAERHWAPATRACTALLGAAAAIVGLTQRASIAEAFGKHSNSRRSRSRRSAARSRRGKKHAMAS